MLNRTQTDPRIGWYSVSASRRARLGRRISERLPGRKEHGVRTAGEDVADTEPGHPPTFPQPMTPTLRADVDQGAQEAGPGCRRGSWFGKARACRPSPHTHPFPSPCRPPALDASPDTHDGPRPPPKPAAAAAARRSADDVGRLYNRPCAYRRRRRARARPRPPQPVPPAGDAADGRHGADARPGRPRRAPKVHLRPLPQALGRRPDRASAPCSRPCLPSLARVRGLTSCASCRRWPAWAPSASASTVRACPLARAHRPSATSVADPSTPLHPAEASPAPSRSFPVYFADGEIVYPQFAYPLRNNIVRPPSLSSTALLAPPDPPLENLPSRSRSTRPRSSPSSCRSSSSCCSRSGAGAGSTSSRRRWAS